ncbi:MAG: DnaK suppressor protein [Lysobacterales bacterium]|jgi:DnaK suppressor protein
MEDCSKEEVKTEINVRIKQLEKDIKALEISTKPIPPDRAIGRIARMDMIQVKSIHESNLNAARDSMMKLKFALGKIDEPEFGMCSYCRKPIGFERLLVMPESNKCIVCAEKFN